MGGLRGSAGPALQPLPPLVTTGAEAEEEGGHAEYERTREHGDPAVEDVQVTVSHAWNMIPAAMRDNPAKAKLKGMAHEDASW